MLKVHRCQSLFGRIGRETFNVEHGPTAGELLDRFKDSRWTTAPLCVTVNGRRAEMGTDVPDGAHVVVAPDPGVAAVVIPFIFKLIVLVAISYALQRLTAHKPLDDTLDRGDDDSPVHSFQGVQTSYGPGFTKPVFYGRHAVGGQAIATDVRSLPGTTNVEVLSMLLALSEGPCYAIGGVTGKGTGGEVDSMGYLTDSPSVLDGAWPDGVKIDENSLSQRSATISVRMGEIYQTPVPEFYSTKSTVSSQVRLDAADDTAIVVIPNADADLVRIRLDFPGGLYVTSGGGYSPTDFDFKYDWRVDDQPWVAVQLAVVGFGEAKRGRFFYDQEFNVGAPAGAAQIELRVTRTSPAGGDIGGVFTQNAAVLKDVVYTVKGRAAYPYQCLAAITARATAKQNGKPTYKIPLQGRTLRVYDATLGLSGSEYWDLPEPGDDYDGIWSYPPGQNPAWVALDLLTNPRYGMGAEVTPTKIDLDAFRDWADYCDQDDSNSEAFLRFDGGFDQSGSAVDALSKIFKAGRAVPMMSGSLVSVYYNYRDAHGRGSNTVPARGVSALVCTSNVADFVAQYIDTTNAPNMLYGQFLNEDLNYEQDSLPVEDPASAINDPADANLEEMRPSTIELYGVTRPSQVRRELYFLHNLTRLANKTCGFTCGIDQLAVEVGDIIAVQHDSYRATYDDSDEAKGWRTAAATAAASTITLDHDVTIETSGDKAVKVTETDGTVTEVYLTDVAETYAAGTALATSAAITVAQGVAVAIGKRDTGTGDTYATQSYVVTSISLGPDLTRDVEALLWAPEAFDLPVGADVDFGTGSEEAAASTDLAGTDVVPDVSDVEAVRVGEDSYSISWEMPDGYWGRAAKVYGGTPPMLLGESTSGQLTVSGLGANPVGLRVAIEDVDGIFADPEATAATTVQASEFIVTDRYSVATLTATDTGDGITLEWTQVPGRNLTCYEVRRGTEWGGAAVVAKTRDLSVHLSRIPDGSRQYLVRALFVGGLYSPIPAVATVDYAGPLGDTTHGTLEDLVSSGAGTATDCTWADGALTMDEGIHEASYVSAALSFETPATVFWAAEADYYEVDIGTTVDELTYRLDDPRAMWRTASTAEPTHEAPGGRFDYTVDDLAGYSPDQAAALLEHPGQVGRNTEVILEARWDPGGESGYGAWEAFRPQVRTATAMQLRLTMHRLDTKHQIYIDRLAGLATS